MFGNFSLKVDFDRRVLVGTQRVRLDYAKGAPVILCIHPTCQHSAMVAAPDKKSKPALLFTNRPN